MLDDFREQADKASILRELEDEGEAPSAYTEPIQPRSHFLGMTPAQRLIIAAMLLVLACILSTFCLLVTQKVVLPLPS